MKEFMILAPIIGLFLIGLFITLRSGAITGKEIKGASRVSVMVENFSAVFLRVVGYLAGILVVQQAIGFPSVLSW